MLVHSSLQVIGDTSIENAVLVVRHNINIICLFHVNKILYRLSLRGAQRRGNLGGREFPTRIASPSPGGEWSRNDSQYISGLIAVYVSLPLP